MSDSTNVVTRFVAVLFFLFAGAGVYGVMTHSKLEAAEQRLSKVEQERTTLQDKLASTEKTATTNATEAKTCAMQMEEFKTRAQSAESALEGAKSKKTPARPTAG
jgi:septal ring factor EnvC (AmiA/AmiB activator)